MKAWKRLAACVVWLAAPGAVAAEPGGGPIIKRCLVSLADEARVPAQEAGVLVEVSVREGDRVTAGQVIARLADDQPEMEKKKAEAEHDQAKEKAASNVDVEFAEESLELAKLDLQKSQDARKASAQSVTEIVLKEKGLAVTKAELQIRQAKLEKKLAGLAATSKGVEVEAAELAIKRRVIRSPIDGVVEDVAKHQGEWMQPGDTLAHVLRTDTLRVEGYVDASKWAPGAIRDRPVTVEVTLANDRVETFEGRIAYVSEQDESGGDYPVYADVRNRRAEPAAPGVDGEWLLRAGQTATMTIHTTRPPVPR